MGRQRLSLFLLFLCILLTGWPALGSAATKMELIGKEPLVTLVFFEMDLREALRELALQTGVNIMMDENVAGTVTLDLVDTPLEKALRMMLVAGGFTYRKVEDYYLVGLADPRNRAFIDLAETEIFFFQNTRVETVEALLPEAFKSYVRFDRSTNAVTITAPRAMIERIIADFRKMDVPRPQVKIKALVSEVRTEVVKEWGIDLFNWEFSAGQKKNPDWTAILELSPGAAMIETDIFGLLHTKMRALEKKGEAKIYADPVVVVADGKTADLFVGDHHNLILRINDNYDRVEKIEAGTGLAVNPRVFEKHIELDVRQTVSYFVENGVNEPVVRVTEFGSTLRLVPGQTLLVSGLTQRENKSRESGMPVLSRIPLVGLLFRENGQEQKESELLIFLSAEVVEGG